jgi:hypothetical protein
MGPGKTVVVVLPDSGTRYITKFLSDPWMRDHGFMEPDRGLGLVEDLLRASPRPVITARETDTVESVAHLLRDKGVSQVPLVSDGALPRLIVHEIDLLAGCRAARSRRALPHATRRARSRGSCTPRHGSKSCTRSSTRTGWQSWWMPQGSWGWSPRSI